MIRLLSLDLSGLVPAALANAQPAQGGWQQAVSPIIPLVLMFAIFYFLMIRPQQKRQKQHQQFLTDLKKGDMVVTNGGIVGTIKNLSDKLVTLEVDNDVCIKLLRAQILESANSLKPAKA